MSALAPTLQGFFIERLIGQKGASRNTVAAYRTSLSLLVRYAAGETGKKPSDLDMADIDAPLVGAFLAHLESDRHNCPRTRNNRLAAIHSLFAYAALRHPEHAASIQRVLAIPTKRHERNIVSYFDDDEVKALLDACDRDTFTGRRDHAMFVLDVQTGLRLSELVGLTCSDVTFGTGANVHTLGKGRKGRRTPLVRETVEVLRAWLAESGGTEGRPLFPTRSGGHLSRDAVEHRLAHYKSIAATSCPSLISKRVTMHAFRHTCAMNLLDAGVDIAVIALWLGHSQVSSTGMYFHADMRQKERAIARVAPRGVKPGRYVADDQLLTFLAGL